MAVAFIPPVWAIILFRREGTEVNPTSPTNQLVTSGPYQFTRNPMYLGLVTLALGIALWIGSWPMFIAPVAIFATANWVHIPFEEAKMRRQFEATYEDYVERVRRWVSFKKALKLVEDPDLARLLKRAANMLLPD